MRAPKMPGSFISDEIYHGLDYAFPAEMCCAQLRRCAHRQLVLQIFLHDRLASRLDGGADALVRAIERLQQNLAISVPTLSQIAAEAAFEGRDEMEKIRRGYQENRRILIEGLPRAGSTRSCRPTARFILCRRVALHLRQLCVRQADAGTGGRRGHAGGRFRSACAGQNFCACVMPARAKRCAKRSSGSGIG